MNKLVKFKMTLLTWVLGILYTTPVLAAEPTLVTGTRKLITDVTKILTGFCASVTIVVALVFLFKMQTSGEDEKPKYKKGLKNTLIIGVLITCIAGIVSWIFSYYA